MQTNQQMLDQMAVEVSEMMGNTIAIKGEAFTRIVAALFHQLQLIWMVAVMSGLVDEESEEIAANFTQLICRMAAATMNALCADLSPEDAAEAKKLAEQMHKRQVELKQRMKNETL